LIGNEPTGRLIAPFTASGRRTLDTLLRSAADSYGHTTFGLSLVERQLSREVELRALHPEDLQRLRQRLDDLLGQEDGGHAR
jgi:hypothetical protein